MKASHSGTPIFSPAVAVVAAGDGAAILELAAMLEFSVVLTSRFVVVSGLLHASNNKQATRQKIITENLVIGFAPGVRCLFRWTKKGVAKRGNNTRRASASGRKFLKQQRILSLLPGFRSCEE
jgi:hypothetical protein